MPWMARGLLACCAAGIMIVATSTSAGGASLYGHLMEGTPYATPVYVVGEAAEHTVLLTGGVHGDETAGHLAARQVVAEGFTMAGVQLVVIPAANKPALDREKRTSPGDPDLNRVFPGDPGGHPLEQLAHQIMTLMDKCAVDFVIDLHESLRSIFDDETRLGETIIFNRRDAAVLAAMEAADRVAADHPGLRLDLVSPPAAGSLVDAAGAAGVPGVIVESDRSQEMEERVAYQRILLAALLEGIVSLP